MPYSDSEAATVTLALQGVWLHDPDDPEGTAAHYLYGGAAKESSVDTMPAAVWYAGRTYPVTDYGEHEDSSVAVSIQVPFGADWQATVTALESWARTRNTVWLRDGRGRSAPGTLSGFKIADAKWGSLVTFTHGRVHYAVEEVAV